MKYKERAYRKLIKPSHLVSFRAVVKETDLFVHADKKFEKKTIDLILIYRGFIENYIKSHPEFLESLLPWSVEDNLPAIVKDMVIAGKKAGVGPMAAVAGAIAEYVGKDLLRYTNEVMVENGGDIFIKTNYPVSVGIFAGESPLSLKMGLSIDTSKEHLSICTSSGTVGCSLSTGVADAVCVVSRSCALADAAATAMGNIVQGKKDIQKAVDFGKKIRGLRGVVIIKEESIGLWGDLNLVPLN